MGFLQTYGFKIRAPVVTSINSEKPVFTIGIPDKGKSYQLNEVELFTESNGTQSDNMVAQDMIGANIKTTQYMFLGDSLEIRRYHP